MNAQLPEGLVKEFAFGNIRASIWQNKSTENGKTIVRHSVRIQKRICDPQTKNWRSTEYFFLSDLPRLMLVAGKAYAYLAMMENDDAEEPAAA